VVSCAPAPLELGAQWEIEAHILHQCLRRMEELGSEIGYTILASKEYTLSVHLGGFMAQQSPSDIVRHASTWSILCGVALIVLGVLAVGSPALAAVAVNAVIAWLIVLAGAVHLSLAFYAHRAGSVLWKVLVGLAYIFFGVYLIAHPSLGVVSLTLVLASLFLVEGIFDIALFFQMRAIGGSGWILVDGIITLLLGLMIYLQWPSSSNWAIGTLVGVSLIVSGVTRLMLSLAVRKVAADLASLSPGKAA
jgi:uncharacterized membrane protein HdeD (DUF308 family)